MDPLAWAELALRYGVPIIVRLYKKSATGEPELESIEIICDAGIVRNVATIKKIDDALAEPKP